jgi:hypothetical protein
LPVGPRRTPKRCPPPSTRARAPGVDNDDRGGRGAAPDHQHDRSRHALRLSHSGAGGSGDPTIHEGDAMHSSSRGGASVVTPGRGSRCASPSRSPTSPSPGPTRAAIGTPSSGSATGRSSPCPCFARTKSSAACPSTARRPASFRPRSWTS